MVGSIDGQTLLEASIEGSVDNAEQLGETLAEKFCLWARGRYFQPLWAIIKMPNKPVLVIRPLREEDAFLKLLDEASISFKYIPIMQIQSLNDGDKGYKSIVSCIDRLQQFDQIIFISANAAEIGLPIIAKRYPLLPENLEFLAVGQQTADIFCEYNYSVSFPQKQPNTEGLLAELPQLQNLQGKKVLILRGGQGRQTLGEELVQRGAMVEYCELYQRQIQSQNFCEAKTFYPVPVALWFTAVNCCRL